MKILYRQSPSDKREISSLAHSGVNNCYFKLIRQTSGDGDGTKNRHSHTGFEFHIMLEGSQLYETEKGSFLLESGKILAVPKGVPHSLLASIYPIEKYAFTFSLDDGVFDDSKLDGCLLFSIPDRVRSNILAATELHNSFSVKRLLIENCVLETVLLLLREIGVAEGGEALRDEIKRDNNEDERVELARQFIADNVESPLQSGEVAAYCYISEKQLNRLFMADIGMTVAAYIRCQRIRRIEELLSDTRMPLTEISEQMGFPNEYGFNVFFKKYNGMPPGEYRKMTNSGKE